MTAGTAPGHLRGRQEVVILLATRILMLGFSVGTQSLLAYALLPEGRGAYALCVLFALLAGVATTPGSDRGSQYFVMSTRLSVSQGVSAGFAICLIGSGLAVAAALPLIHSGLALFGKADPASFYLALVLIPLSTLMATTQRQIAGLRRFLQLAGFTLVRAGTVVLSTAALVWGLGMGVNGAIGALALGQAAMLTIGVFDLRRNCGLRFQIPSREAVGWVLRYGLRLYVVKIGSALEYRVSGLVLGLMAAPGDIGLFVVGVGLVTEALIASKSISTYLLPRVAADQAGRPQHAAFCCRVSVWATGALLLAGCVVSVPLVPLLLSESFSAAVPLIWIMSVGVAGAAVSQVCGTYFRGTNRPGVASWAMWVGLCANVGLLFLAFPEAGITGAAWALTAGMLARGLFLTYMFRRATGLPYSAVFLLRPNDVARVWNSGKRLLAAGARRSVA